jgi:putative acetyltransferase
MTLSAGIRLHDGTFSPGEAALIAGIWRRAWAAGHADIATLEPIAHWLARVQAEFKPPNELLVAERNGQPLAFMGLHRERGYVSQLYVDPHLRRQGLGRALLDEACVRMPVEWRLHVAAVNVDAQRFYESYGLVRGLADRQPGTGRERMAYHWPAPQTQPGPP